MESDFGGLADREFELSIYRSSDIIVLPISSRLGSGDIKMNADVILSFDDLIDNLGTDHAF